ncbi:MAG TPA: MerR family transcriptional regulator [Firmicutes bacterium]|nr:MerR family transcriptional regulator [Bacillota bacterium]
MDIRNCKRCGNIYHYNGTGVCNNCTEQEQKDFSVVRDYLFEHPNSPAAEINMATGIELKVISRFLKEGRLKMEGEGLLSCEKCGETIKAGRFCEKCLQEIQSELQKTIKPLPKVQGIGANTSPWSQAKVHTYDHILKKKD